jgi:hypothetical protein
MQLATVMGTAIPLVDAIVPRIIQELCVTVAHKIISIILPVHIVSQTTHAMEMDTAIKPLEHASVLQDSQEQIAIKVRALQDLILFLTSI